MIFKYLNNIKTAFFGLVVSLFKLKPLPLLGALDRLVNAIWGGDPQETISSRAGKLVRAGDRKIAYYLCKVLNFIHKGHCEQSIDETEGSDQLIVLDRGVVIGTVLFMIWWNYPELFMPLFKVML